MTLSRPVFATVLMSGGLDLPQPAAHFLRRQNAQVRQAYSSTTDMPLRSAELNALKLLAPRLVAKLKLILFD